ncbi:MAG: hypothetical protein WAU14_00545, partial [Dokdonella sp.]|uniref:hypothetical protein n=1 Tax=Dokdonella sp. TaxID=2291710 RepID=UPI003BAF08C4
MPIRNRATRLSSITLGMALASLTTHATAKPDRSDQRQHYRNVMQAIAHGPVDSWKREITDLADYPLLPYVELALVQRGHATPPLSQVVAFLKR